jgi:hypothetical protein
VIEIGKRDLELENRLMPWQRSYFEKWNYNLRSSHSVTNRQQRFNLETIDLKDMRARRSINFRTIVQKVHMEHDCKIVAL